MTSRACAVLDRIDPLVGMAAMGARQVYAEKGCGLGYFNDKGTGGSSATPFRFSDGKNEFRTVGDATLYNRAELLGELLQAGAELPHDCPDGEVLSAYYATFGEKRLGRVRGMFCLIIWDHRKLKLITDPLGSRSIFYTGASGSWAAAASMQALRRWPKSSPRIDIRSVQTFLSAGYLFGAQTLLERVFRVPPASIVTLSFETENPEPVSYWMPSEGPWNEADPPETYASHLRELLEISVKDCLGDNDEVGVFLSGGLDSSIVTALAAKFLGSKIRTYTINFGIGANELEYANLVAGHCQTEHKILTHDGNEVMAHFGEAVRHMDCPVGEGLTVPNLLLARSAAKDGLKVILNGEGGDPCFGGPKNIPMVLFELHRHDSHDPDGACRAYLQAHRHCYDDLSLLLTPEATESALGKPSLESLLRPYLGARHLKYYLNRLMFTNLRLKGPGYMLAKVEFLTASQGVRGRYPLFDKSVVDYSYRIPPKYKLMGDVEKFALKLAVKDLLPEEILLRPKSGMRMPLRHWLKGPIRKLANHLLFAGSGKSRSLFRKKTLESWLNEKGLVNGRYAQRLWLVLTLEAWLRVFLDGEELSTDCLFKRRT